MTANSPPALIQLMVGKYHCGLRQCMPRMLQLVSFWDQLQQRLSEEVLELSPELQIWRREVEQHFNKEEDEVFPALIQGRGAYMSPRVRTLEMEHQDHWNAMAHFEAAFEVGTKLLSESSEVTVADPSLVRKAKQFAHETRTMFAQMREHLKLEEQVLFPLVLSAKLADHLED